MPMNERREREWIVKIGILSEIRQDERRIALVPEVAARLVTSGCEVVVEAGAGERASFTDDGYREAGVGIEANRQTLLSTADIVLSVQPVRVEDVMLLRSGAATLSFLQPG